jgi:N-methylhydantoinase A/oxoprolinase/acetone carboxylase beta subunit
MDGRMGGAPDAMGRGPARGGARPLDEDDVRRKLRVLMDAGARSIVVSLLWSFANPAHELRVKEIIREEYKEYHIGYLPVILSHQVVAKLGEYERTMTAVLDAYLQRAMQTELSATWDRLRELGYRGSFLMIHNSGGSGEVFKTTASRTYNGGPVSGLMGSYHLATELGFNNVVAGDMGGTSFDIGLVVDQSVRNYEFRPVIDRWMVGITMLQTLSIGAGGGPGVLRPGRRRADRHRRRCRARLHQPRQLLRRANCAGPREGRGGHPVQDRRADWHRR